MIGRLTKVLKLTLKLYLPFPTFDNISVFLTKNGALTPAYKTKQ
jgi:hypothetical protein